MGKRALVEQFLTTLAVGDVINRLKEAGAHVGAVAVTDGFNEKVPETLITEEFAEDIENAAPQGLPPLLDLLEETLEDVTLAGGRWCYLTSPSACE
jgi:hypothetical protein